MLESFISKHKRNDSKEKQTYPFIVKRLQKYFQIQNKSERMWANII